jgi:hypothetical protein
MFWPLDGQAGHRSGKRPCPATPAKFPKDAVAASAVGDQTRAQIPAQILHDPVR